LEIKLDKITDSNKILLQKPPMNMHVIGLYNKLKTALDSRDMGYYGIFKNMDTYKLSQIKSILEGYKYTNNIQANWYLKQASTGNWYIADKSYNIFSEDYRFTGKRFYQKKRSLTPRMTKVYNAINANLSILYGNLQKSKLLEEQIVIKKHIDILNNYKDMLVKDQNMSVVYELANKELDIFSERIRRNSFTRNNMRIAFAVTDFWSNINNILFDIGANTEESLEIERRAKEINSAYEKIALQHLVREAKAKNFDLSAVDFKYIDNEMLKSWMADISASKNKSVQYIDTILKDAARRRDLFVMQKIKKFYEIKDKAGVKDYDMFFEVGPDGNYTSNLVNPIRESFKEELRHQRVLLETDTKGNYDNYVKFLRNNTLRVDTRRLDDVEYLNQLKEEFQDDYYFDTIIKDAHKQIEKYELDYQSYKDYLEEEASDLYDNQEAINNHVKKGLEEFDNQNNPNKYFDAIDLIESGEMDNRILKDFKGYKYMHVIPRKTDLEGKKLNWFNDKYFEIKKDVAKFELYRYVKDNLEQFISYLPKDKVEGLGQLFLPQVHKDFIKRLSSNGMSGIMKHASEFFVENLSSTSRTIRDEMFDPVAGTLRQQIPLHLLRRKVTQDERSRDLGQLFELMAYASSNYKFMSEVESDVLMANRFISNAQSTSQTSTVGTETKQAVAYSIGAALYGIRAEQTSKDKGSFGKTMYTKDDKYVMEQHEKELLTLENNLVAGLITQEEYEESKMRIEAQIESIGRKYSLADIGDAAIKLTYLKAFAYNPFPAMANVIYGITSNYIKASGEQDFTTAQANKALKLILSSVRDESMHSKISNLLDSFGIVSHIQNAEYGKYTEMMTKNNKLDPNYLMMSSDYIMKAQTMIAYMLNTKVTTKEGKEISLWDAYDSTGTWEESKFDSEINDKFSGDVLDKTSMKGFREFQDKLHKIVKIHGNFDPNSPAMYKKNIVGRLIGQFRFSWLAEGFMYRWGAKRDDIVLGREVKGIYRSFGALKTPDRSIVGTVGETLRLLARKLLLQKTTFKEGDNLSPEDVANMKQALTEAQIVIMLSLAIMLLKGLNDDDDEKNRYLTLIVNNAIRLRSDTMFYLSSDIFDMGKNIVPAAGVLTDTYDAIKSIVDNITDEDYDGTRTVNKIFKALPYGGPVRSTIKYTDKFIE